MIPAYTPKSLGETYLDIIMPMVEWYLSTKGGTVVANNGDLRVGSRVYKKVNADDVGWL